MNFLPESERGKGPDSSTIPEEFQPESTTEEGIWDSYREKKISNLSATQANYDSPSSGYEMKDMDSSQEKWFFDVGCGIGASGLLRLGRGLLR